MGLFTSAKRLDARFITFHHRAMRQLLFRLPTALIAVLLIESISPGRAQDRKNSHARWEPEIQAFEAADRTNPPPAHAILLIGSSSVRLWKNAARDLQPFPVVNRGFGGSEMADGTYFADRIVLPYRPRQVLVYAGDNDLASGKSPERVSLDFQAFVRKVRAALPDVAIAYISIKPSPTRWKLVEQMRAANALIAAFIKTDRQLAFIDVFTPMLADDGRPRPELFREDALHLNEQGYALWATALRPYLRPDPALSVTRP
jgi:lysophospholipase L1-like esterase